jgi:putative transposase
MKKTRFTDEQVTRVLKQGEAAMKTAESCRQQGISSATFHKWEERSAGLAQSQARGPAPRIHPRSTC